MTQLLERQVYRLHVTADGQVWEAAGMECPRQLPVSVEDAPLYVQAHGVSRVRMLGTHANVPVIRSLYEFFQGTDGRLELAGPRACCEPAELTDPERVLFRMRQCYYAASLGGWHQMQQADYATYRLAELVQTSAPENLILAATRTHPGMPLWSFLPGLNLGALARVLSWILDPRWFIDLKHPYRLSRLRAWLGLTDRTVRRNPRTPGERRRWRRYGMVLRTWKGREPSRADAERPEYFLWRRWRAAGGGSRGDLRASQAFLVFLVRNWQQVLLGDNPQRVELFDPDALLRRSEVAAWRTHRARLLYRERG